MNGGPESTAATELHLLRAPDLADSGASQIGRYLEWLRNERGHRELSGWDDLHRWSVEDLEGFWASIWDWHAVTSYSPYERVLTDRRMPGATWFPGARLNYAEHVLRGPCHSPAQTGLGDNDEQTAIIAYSQSRDRIDLSWQELSDQVARVSAGLQALGVGPGDRVVGYLPNIPETVVAFLATATLGAIWAACAPEFGARAVIDRFAQIEPVVLLAIDGYDYGDKYVDRTSEVAQIRAGLPTLRQLVHVPYGRARLPGSVDWETLVQYRGSPVPPLPVAFDHPLCVLFSSGTTGVPKAIVHGHGGILLEHFKNHSLSWDLRPGDRMLWFTTTAWMMWNSLVSGLLTRACIVLVDGNPMHPDQTLQWRIAAESRATLMGASPGFLMSCRKAGLAPARDFDLSALRQIGAAGSPLPAEGYLWVYEQFGPRVLLNVGSGGTDVCSGVVQGSPLQPVWAGEISGACLGVDAQAFDPDGRRMVGELGELVIAAPMPSMPVGFWRDDDGSRYRAAYFDTYPGIWRFGDWVRFSPEGSCIITGRSDATLNRGGVRLGTAEFYRVTEELAEVLDSLVVHLEDPAGGNGELLLYVVLQEGRHLDDELRGRLRAELRRALSPRHVPDVISQVAVIPRNRTGKKLELPVKRILQGDPAHAVIGTDTLAVPGALDAFVAVAVARRDSQ